jgi:peroxiredoxin
MLPKRNSIAPDFTLPDQDETMHSLSDYRGMWVLLYFYPKDDTPGCTRTYLAISSARVARDFVRA